MVYSALDKKTTAIVWEVKEFFTLSVNLIWLQIKDVRKHAISLLAKY